MKQLTCEMCGSTELIKQDGFFVCQTCGCKYSVEEAKKMMIEGTVDVQGTVKVDNSAFVEKYLLNARRAMQKEDWEETEKYYNMVEQNDPTNIEAIFYSAYGKAKSALIENDIFKRQAAFKVLQNSVSVLDDNYDTEKGEELKPIIIQIKDDIIAMKNSSYVYTQTTTQYGTTTDKNKTEVLFFYLINEYATTIHNIIKKYGDTDINNILYLFEIEIELRMATQKIFAVNKKTRDAQYNVVKALYAYIKSRIPDYPVPVLRQSGKLDKKTIIILGIACGIGGCIAAAWLICMLIALVPLLF